MTLLEILVKEIPRLGGWPEGVSVIEQLDDGCLYDPYGDCLFSGREFNLSEDYEDAFVTNDKYEAALSASKATEWNGEGLPPVGCECEVAWSGAKFIPCKILYIGVSVVLVRLDRSEECYTLSTVKFRPIRSAANRKRLEVAEALIRFLDLETDIDNVFHAGDVKDFLDYIAAGKIPGIRIE
ncbi:Uncharacterised protein [Cedecea lapagei]|uniref:Uncharacterized protein n=1 Tax=Cedecea lapagei TaxID=158823 RepID=A0A447V5R8_9ENTR|nr:hypothetical protein [Cedecea lapagei]VEC00275.1 Uncharacterised protein [Cedecea lapagei]